MKLLVGLVLLSATVVLAFGAFPIGVWVGWRVASGSWSLPDLVGERVSVGRILWGVGAGGLTFRFGLLVRRELLAAWKYLPSR
jgi:hypothetical protein